MPVVRLAPICDWYVSPAELGGWLGDWVRELDLRFLFARHRFPGEAKFKYEVCRRLAWTDALQVTRVICAFETVYLSGRPLRADVANADYLAVVNLDYLRINLPRFSDRGMTGIGLSLGQESTPTDPPYQAILADLHERTRAGVSFRFAKGKKKEWHDPECRYSPGAALLLEHGIPLTAGGNIVVAQFGGKRKTRS